MKRPKMNHLPAGILSLLCAALLIGASEAQSPSLRSEAAAQAARSLHRLDDIDPYAFGLHSPKLTTPQWIGEADVEAVVVLSIDDLGDATKYETYLRPILDRLKEIDGRAGLTITVNKVDPAEPLLQKWLGEGVSLETHTTAHACPMLCKGDLAAVKEDFDRCVDLLFSIPNNRPVGFRVPCCDSMNATSPRFFAELFNKRSPAGNFLTVDSSVFNLFTPDDPAIPRDLVEDADGRGRFLKYVPQDRGFANSIENYPYPYLIGNFCWELPGVMPSDWNAFHLHEAENPFTVEDWQSAIDITVLKEGLFTLVFHPHGWIRNDQIVSLIDHTVHHHAGRVKFLSFREVSERLTKNLLLGQSIRAADGLDNGVRLLDLNADGFMDVVIGNDRLQVTRLWDPEADAFVESSFPVPLFTRNEEGIRQETGVRFGCFGERGAVGFIFANEETSGAWTFNGENWIEDPHPLPVHTVKGDRDQGVRFRDLDGDLVDELLIGNPEQGSVYRREANGWRKLPFDLPGDARIVDSSGGDFGTRLVDLDDDFDLDVVASNEKGSAVYLFSGPETGWETLAKAEPGAGEALPPIALAGKNNGAWVHGRALYWNNERTDSLEHKIVRRAFNDLLGETDSPAKEAAAALKSIHVRPGFEVELVAIEPMVQDPVAFDWGPDGALWVAEMADYPEGAHGPGVFGSRIRRIEDSDGDGVYDRSTVFLEPAPLANGVLAWGKGVLVTCAPDIVYAEDTDGDGVADRTEVLYTGFENINEQHVVNGLRWGLDNWVYCANGDSGGKIRSTRTGEEASISGRDLRIDPERGLIEPIAGLTQFGRVRDDWGNWFGCSNPNPGWSFVQDDRYISRNPHLAAPRFRKDVSILPGPSPVYPTSRTLARYNDPWMVNRFTSACGIEIYRDDLLGSLFEGNSFVCEPVHNLVHREIVRPEGVAFTSRRPPDELASEFLSSTDNWFRPVMARTGPDGALWIADMYRERIEHPEYVPIELQEGVDFRAGEDRGRIYRVFPVGARPPLPTAIAALEPAELAKAFDVRNGAQRDRVHLHVVHEKKTETVPHFLRLAAGSTLPEVRVQSLCILEGLGVLTAGEVLHALADPHPEVQRCAVRLAERFLDQPGVAAAVVQTAEGAENPFLVQQIAYTLGEWEGAGSGATLADLATKVGSDADLRAAILSSLHGKNLAAFADRLRGSTPVPEVWEAVGDMAFALGDSTVFATLADSVLSFEGAPLSEIPMGPTRKVLSALTRENAPLNPEDRPRLQTFSEVLFDTARKVLDDPDAPAEEVRIALEILSAAPERTEEDYSRLSNLLSPLQSPEVQSLALAGLQSAPVEEAAPILLSGWRERTPDLREKILSIFFRNPVWIPALLSGVESTPAIGRDLDARQRQILLAHSDPEIRARAEGLFAQAADSDRAQVVEAFRKALEIEGSAAAGRAVFEERCAKCHVLSGLGRPLGPDLAALSDKSAEALLISILDPNRAVESKYRTYMADTVDGLSYSGLLVNESGNSITLAMDDGAEAVLLRSDLDLFEGSTLSFMPEGLEVGLEPQGLADLIAFVRESGPPMKSFPGNQPILVTPEPYRRELWLLSTTAEIYGDTLVMEEGFENLGGWRSLNDHAAWNFMVEEPGEYSVSIDYSLAPGGPVNQFVLEAAGQRITGEVGATAGWEDYRIVSVGELTLAEGPNRLVLRPLLRLEGELMKLRSVALRPKRK